MPAKEISLFQSAAGKLRISRLGPLTMLVIDGQGHPAKMCETEAACP